MELSSEEVPQMDAPCLDFSRVCRTCKCITTEARSIFELLENSEDGTHIHEMLMACSSVKVGTEDGLPAIICEICVEQLQGAYYFRKQCETVDHSLREYVKTLRPEGVKLEQSEVSKYIEKLFNSPQQDTENVQVDEPQPAAVTAPSEKPICPPPAVSDYIQLMDNSQMVLTCSECGKVFTTLEGLRCHKRIHSGTLFKCKFCEKQYTRQNHLNRHEQSHQKRKVHVCRICNKTLTRFEHLKRHLTTHLKEKPFACPRCKRGFNRREHLDVHVSKCKGDRVHICDICNKGFNRADSLELHKKLHENTTPILPTLDNLDNIEDHYFEIDYDAATVFSDNSDNEMDDCFEPQVEVRVKEPEDSKVKFDPAGASTLTKSEPTEDSKDWNNRIETEEYMAEDMDDFGGEENNAEDGAADFPEPEDDFDRDVGEDLNLDDEEGADVKPEASKLTYPEAEEEDSDSNHSEYSPTKTSPKSPQKRGRGRPRKHPPKERRAKIKKKYKKIRVMYDEEEEEEVGVFPCPVCEQLFAKMSLLEKHASADHPNSKVFKCKECNKDFSRSTHLKRHMLSHSNIKPYQCEVCTKKFSRKDHLTQHMKLHYKQQECICEVCQKPFHRADHLAKHMASKHNIGEKIISEKKFECHVCGKTFTTEKYRDVHVKGHEGKKCFQCKTCEKSFLSKSHLTEHMKFHNENSKKFLCSECGQRFIRNDYLVIHMRRHRGEKPFKCKFCGKGFPRTTDLTVHERYHTGEKTHLCTICGRGFGRAYNLTVHMRTHTGEKPYQCTYCDAAFAQGNDLKAHVRRHTGERFQCELCSENFLMGYLLTQHKRTVHGLNVVSNIRRLQPVQKLDPENPNEPPPITIPLPKPIIPEMVNVPTMVTMNHLHSQLTIAQLQHHMATE